MSIQFDVQHMEAQRFLLTSLANPENVQLVDLEEYKGYGECSCEYFTFKIGPQLKKGKEPLKQCRHLRLIKTMIQNLK